MHDFGQVTFFADEAGDGSVEWDGKTSVAAARHLAGGFYGVIKVKQGEFKRNGLPCSDIPLGVDKNPVGADIFHYIPEFSFSDPILNDNEWCAAWVPTLIIDRIVFLGHIFIYPWKPNVVCTIVHICIIIISYMRLIHNP